MVTPEMLEEVLVMFEKDSNTPSVIGDFKKHELSKLVCDDDQGFNTYKNVIEHIPTKTLWEKLFIAHSEWGVRQETNWYKVTSREIVSIQYAAVSDDDIKWEMI